MITRENGMINPNEVRIGSKRLLKLIIVTDIAESIILSIQVNA